MTSHQDLPRAVPQSISRRLFLRQALPTVAGLGIGSSLLLQDKELRAIAGKGGIIGIWPNLRRRDTFENFLKDIDHVQRLVGTDHVGMATDLFGLDDHTAIPTHKEFSLIPTALLKRGYPDVAIARIIGGNFMKLFREVTEGAG